MKKKLKMKNRKNYKLVFTLQEWFLLCYHCQPLTWAFSNHWPKYMTQKSKKWVESGPMRTDSDPVSSSLGKPIKSPACLKTGRCLSLALISEDGSLFTLCFWGQCPARGRDAKGECAFSFLTPVCLVCLWNFRTWFMGFSQCVYFPLRVIVHLSKLYSLFLCSRMERPQEAWESGKTRFEPWASVLCLIFLIWKMEKQWVPQGGIINTWRWGDTMPGTQNNQTIELVLSSYLVRKRLSLVTDGQSLSTGSVGYSCAAWGRSHNSVPVSHPQRGNNGSTCWMQSCEQ